MKTSSVVSVPVQVGDGAVRMTMDVQSDVFMMNMLSKLYRLPAQAVLREYLSNAVDAHKARGGVLPPVRVILPSGGDNLLSVRDYGAGLSEEGFESLLSRYGASSKRETNELIGGFGLGAKAGFALGDEFFMTSYQSGVGLRVRLFRDADNQGYLEVVERFVTAEPDGLLVEVRIPSKNLGELSDKDLKYFFLGWDADSVEVLFSDSMSKFDFITVHDTDLFSRQELNGQPVGWLSRPSVDSDVMDGVLFVLIGGVQYHLKFLDFLKMLDTTGEKASGFEVFSKYQFFLSVFSRVKVIELPVGSVDLPPSREEIILSERSFTSIMNKLTTYIPLFRMQLQQEINAQDYRTAFQMFMELESKRCPDLGDFKWQGKELGVTLMSKSNARVLDCDSWYGDESEWRQVSEWKSCTRLVSLIDSYSNVVVIPVPDGDEGAWVEEVLDEATQDDSDFEELMREFIKSFPTETLRQRSIVILPNNDVLEEILCNVPVMELSRIEAMVEKKEAKQREVEEAETRRKAEEVKLLSSFIPSADKGGQFLKQYSPETVFADPQEKRYYWSYDEVIELGHPELLKMLFPYYNPDDSAPNTFKPVEQFPYDTYFESDFRSFLKVILPENSRIILVGEHVKLDEFNAQYPEVESGVLTVQEIIQTQLREEDSELNLFRKTCDQYMRSAIPKRMIEFYKYLDATCKEQLSKKFIESVELSKRILETRTRGTLKEDTLVKFLTVFASESVEKVTFEDEHTALLNKYPLLFDVLSLDRESTLNDLFEYVLMKDK